MNPAVNVFIGGSFGKYWESQLPAGHTFEDTLRWQLKMRADNSQKVFVIL